MATSDRTKLCKKRAIIFSIISLVLWIGAAVFSLVSAFSMAGGGFGATVSEMLSEGFKATLVSLGVTMLIALILTIFMQNKMRMTIWMASVIISTICFGQVAMYIMFGIWFIDEYVFHALAKHYRSKYSINKEIDLRD